MKRMPQPIPYQGSKRTIAPQIIAAFPAGVKTLIEPFAGSAAVSIRAAYMKKADGFHLNDLNEPLMNLLYLIINEPAKIANQYEVLWKAQLGQERAFYDQVRAQSNQTYRPDLFLYLLARCVKASVRYNSNGDFNQGPDNRRKGRHPDSMRKEILAVSRLMKNRTTITSRNYADILETVEPSSTLIYMDPPYQGTSRGRDSRYCNGVEMAELVDFMMELNAKNIMFLLSYDGRKGAKNYGEKLPETLDLHRMEIEAGRSTQSTLLGKRDITYESLYLSPALVEKLNVDQKEIDTFQTERRYQQLGFNFA